MGSDKSKINLQYDRQLQNIEQQNEWQSEENEFDRVRNNEIWMEQFRKQNDEWQRRFNVENAYNNPSAQMARLQAAGINPAAMLNELSGSGGLAAPGGSGSVSSPAGGSPHGVSPMGLQNPNGVSSDASLFSSLAQLQDSMSKLGEYGLASERQVALLDATRAQLLSNVQNTQERTILTQLQNSITRAFGHTKASAEVESLFANSYRAYADGDAAKARKLYDEAQKKMVDLDYVIKEGQKPELINSVKYYNDMLQSSSEKNRASAAESRSAVTRNQSQAAYFDSLSATENELRSGRITGQQLSNDLLDIQRQMGNRENVRDAATHHDKIRSIISQCEQQGLISQELAQKVRKARTDADWAEMEKLVGVTSQAIGSFTDLGNMHINSWSQSEKLKLQNKIADDMAKPKYKYEHKYQGSDGSIITESSSY